MCFFRSVLILGVIAAMMTVSGCVEVDDRDTVTPPESISTTYEIRVDLDAQGQPIISLPDGTVYHGFELWREEAPILFQELNERGQSYEFVFEGSLAVELDAVMQDQHDEEPVSEVRSQEQPLSVRIGNYTASTSCKFSYVSGCVSLNAANCAVRLNYGSSQVFDLHFAKYRRNGRACFGVYESVHRWINVCVCNPLNLSAIRDFIYQAALYAGIATATAWILAELLAPAIFVPLLLI